ncbi:MAG: hypothetical protein ACREI3_10625, partial [Nitrospirales bacterium]
ESHYSRSFFRLSHPMKSILVFDDEHQRGELARALTGEGYDVLATGAYPEAADKLTEGSVQVLVVDLTEENSLALLVKARTTYPQVGCIAFAQQATPLGNEFLRLARGFRTQRVLDPPVLSTDIVSAVRELAWPEPRQGRGPAAVL